MLRLLAVGLICAFLALPSATARAESGAIIILDASNSMWGKIGGQHKIEIARQVLSDVIRNWDADTKLGLVAYGHRRRGDCGDIQTVIPVGSLDAESFLATVNRIQPKGKTPLTDAISHAAEALGYREDPATVILLSDGIETCGRDACSVAADMERRGIDFTAHVIGFDVTKASDQAQLRCIAERTGGQFFTASTADELQQALGEAAKATTEKKKPEPEPEVEPAQQVTVEAPDQVTTGATFEVSWEPSVDRNDYVTIVPAGADERERGNYFRVHRGSPYRLTAPAEVGIYEVRYVSNKDKTVLGRDRIEVVEGEVQVTAPESAVAGSTFEVSWTKSINRNDYITIVPAGADDGERGNYFRVHRGSPYTLQAPSETGLYEVRYVLNEGKKVIAGAKIEITEAGTSVSAPEKAVAGSNFEVSWTQTIHKNDYITIVPAGAEDGERGNYFRVHRGSPYTLRAPAEPGLYEVRYVLNEGKKVIASAKIEITAAEASLTAPAKAVAGSNFEVSWPNSIHKNDYITIVPMGAEDSERGNYFRVHRGSPYNLRAPAETGLYEVRYVLNEGKKVLARARIEITEPEVSLTVPEVVRVESPVKVAWTGDTPGNNDYITIVPAGAEDGARGEYRRVHRGNPLEIKAPKNPGLYEVRYILNEGKKVLARAKLEVVSETAAIDKGAGLQAPESAAPGAAISVSWTLEAAGGDHRISLAKADQADFTWIEAKPAAEGPPLEFTAPDEPGLYEIRYLDLEGGKVLGRRRLEVK